MNGAAGSTRFCSGMGLGFPHVWGGRRMPGLLDPGVPRGPGVSSSGGWHWSATRSAQSLGQVQLQPYRNVRVATLCCPDQTRTALPSSGGTRTSFRVDEETGCHRLSQTLTRGLLVFSASSYSIEGAAGTGTALGKPQSRTGTGDCPGRGAE